MKKPKLFPLAVTYSIYGFHFRKIAEEINGPSEIVLGE